MKIYHKLLDPDRYVLLKALGVICGVIFFVLCFPLFIELFLAVLYAVPMKGSIGKLPSTMLLDSIFESLAFGVSGFLMSFVVIFVSRSKDMKPVIYAAVIVAVLPVIVRTGFISSSLSLFFKIYSLLNIILSEVFLFGFAVLGARFLTKINRLKSEKIESESI